MDDHHWSYPTWHKLTLVRWKRSKRDTERPGRPDRDRRGAADHASTRPRAICASGFRREAIKAEVSDYIKTPRRSLLDKRHRRGAQQPGAGGRGRRRHRFPLCEWSAHSDPGADGRRRPVSGRPEAGQRTDPAGVRRGGGSRRRGRAPRPGARADAADTASAAREYAAGAIQAVSGARRTRRLPSHRAHAASRQRRAPREGRRPGRQAVSSRPSTICAARPTTAGDAICRGRGRGARQRAPATCAAERCRDSRSWPVAIRDTRRRMPPAARATACRRPSRTRALAGRRRRAGCGLTARIAPPR